MELKKRVSAALCALAMTLSLAACRGETPPPESSGAPEPPPASRPEKLPEPDPEPEGPLSGAETGVPAVQERIFTSVFQPVDLCGEKALFWTGNTEDFIHNVLELDLAAGTEKMLFTSWMGQAQTDGECYYWVALSDEPSEKTGGCVPVGICKRDGKGNKELIYRLPKDAREAAAVNPVPNYPWAGELRTITDLTLGDGYLAWVESWLLETGEFAGWYAYQMCALDLATMEPYGLVEGAKRNTYRRQLWANGKYLTCSTTPEDYPGSLLVYDMADRGLALEVETRCPAGAFYDGKRLVWANGAGEPHTFFLREENGEVRAVDVLQGETVEVAGSVVLIGGRYVLYHVSQSPDGGKLTKGVRVYDLEQEAVVYRTEEDDRLKRKAWVPGSGDLLPGRDGSQAVLLNGKDGQDKSWLWSFRF